MSRLLILVAVFLIACQDPEPTSFAPAATPRADAFAANPVAFVVQSADRDTYHVSIEDLFRKNQAADPTGALKTLYATRDFQPVWLGSDDRPLNDAGESLLAALLDAEPVHGLWREDLEIEEIQALLEKATVSHELPVVAPSQEALRALKDWEQDHPDATDDEWYEAVADLDGVREAVDQRRKKFKQTARTRAELDVRLSAALAIYGAHMRWENPAWQRPEDWSGNLIDLPTPTPDLANLLNVVFQKPEAVHELLQQLVPPFEAYDALTSSFVAYQKIVANGGWDELPAQTLGLKPGATGPLVVALKERLRREGFWGDENSEHYGPKLFAAVSSYQQSHQLWEDGTITAETLASLNVAAQRRLNQIRVTLGRWRASRLGNDETFVHVNIPDFHAELWRDGQMERRFRVVTGAAGQRWNPELQRNVFPTATPLMSGKLDFVVFNPYWNVPPGIRRAEIEPKAAADANYMDEMGFEVVTDTTGREYMRQKPGEKNALGAVKFLFPNGQDIYLHDTPDKQFFKFPTRAFSHGCVRVDEPLNLAQWLLDGENKWDQAAVDAWYRRPGETWIRLDQPVPVHIEYFVVRVDEQGRTNFLADVYLHDQPLLADVEARLRARAQKADKDG